MSGIGEIVGIIACVAAVISAYKDGAKVVQKIKDKRRVARAVPPTAYLEESLNRGASAVEDAKRAGTERFGEAFKYGDDVALNALRDITIQLQGSMLKELSRALDDDEMNDFSTVVNASDTGRARTVNILNDLFLRMQTEATNRQGIPRLPASQEPGPAIPPQRVQTLPSPDDPRVGPRAAQSPPSPRPKQAQSPKGLSYFAGLSLRRKKSGGSPAATDAGGGQAGGDSQTMAQQIPQRIDQPRSDFWNSPTSDPTPVGDNSCPGHTANAVQEGPTELSRSKRSFTTPEPSSQGSVLSRETTNSRTLPEHQGFCKGAYYLQVRLKEDGMKLRNQSGSFQGEGYYYACSNSKCCFEAPARKINKEWNFPDNVHGPSHGVKFRWSFLAKSHIEQPKAKRNKYQYRCIFCALQFPDAPILQGINSLLEHVSQHQNGQLRTENRVILDSADYDLQFVADGEPADTASLGSGLSCSPIQEKPPWSEPDDDDSVNPWRDYDG